METNKKFCVNCGNPILVKEGQKVASCSKCGNVISLEQNILLNANNGISEAVTNAIENDLNSGSSNIKIFSLTCKHCGNNVAVKEGQKVAQCQFCGNQFAVDDGTRRIEIVDEAQQLRNKIEREELEKQKAAHEAFEKDYAVQKKKRNKWSLVYAVCAIILYILMVTAAYLGYDSDAGGKVEKLIFIIMAYFLFMPIILLAFRPYLPKRENDKADTSKVKSMVLTWLLYLGVIFLAAVTFAVVCTVKG